MRITRGAGGIGTDYFLVAIANAQAYGASNTQAGVAGNTTEFVVVNPAASGKTVRIKYVLASAAAAGTIILATIALDPAYGNLTIRPLKTAGAAGVALFESGTFAGSRGGVFMNFDVPAATSFLLAPGWVVELTQGNTLSITFGAANVQMRVAVAWVEV